MIEFALYDAEGNILQSGMANREADVHAMAARKGLSAYLGRANAERHQIVDGQRVDRVE